MLGKNITLLKDLCDDFKKDIVDGPFGANLKRKHYKSSGIPVLKIQNIKPFAITMKNMDFVEPAKFEELKRHSYKAGDIIMTKLGNPLGESAIAMGIDDGLIVADLVRIRASRVDTRYLCYHLNSPATKAFINEQQKGTTRPRVRLSVVRELPIFTPSIDEQKRIVAILDQAFADLEQVRAKTEQNLKNARELFNSYLEQVFSQSGEGWVDSTLGHVGKVSMCKRILKKQTSSSGDIPFYKIGTFGKEPNAFITNDIYEEFKEKYSFPKKGEILISASGTIGRRVIYDGKPAYFQDSNIVWIDNNEQKVLNEYLYMFYGICDWNPSKGATIARLYNDDLRRIKIQYPVDKLEQRRIVIKVRELADNKEKLDEVYKRKLSSLDELEKSILQKAFSGELTAKAE